MTIKWIKSDKSYYNVETDTIYCHEQYSLQYFHELSHMKDYKNKIHLKIGLSFSELTQTVILCLPIIYLYVFLSDDILTIISFSYLLIPQSAFLIYEESRAIYNSYRWFKQWQKQNENI